MYNTLYNPQVSLDRINTQIAELEKMRSQIQQPITAPTSLTQNFQIAPTNREIIKYASSMEDVQKDIVMGDTPYFAKDMSVVWVKNTKGEIKTYELNEIVAKDEKDLKIEYLQAQIEELKGKIKDEPVKYTDEPITITNKDEEPTSFSKISKFSKKH